MKQLDELVEAAEEAVTAAEHIIAVCETDVKNGNSSNPHVRSMPSAALAECYGATSYVARLRKALKDVK